MTEYRYGIKAVKLEDLTFHYVGSVFKHSATIITENGKLNVKFERDADTGALWLDMVYNVDRDEVWYDFYRDGKRGEFERHLIDLLYKFF